MSFCFDNQSFYDNFFKKNMLKDKAFFKQFLCFFNFSLQIFYLLNLQSFQSIIDYKKKNISK